MSISSGPWPPRGRSGKVRSETTKAAQRFRGGLSRKTKTMAARFRRATTTLLTARFGPCAYLSGPSPPEQDSCGPFFRLLDADKKRDAVPKVRIAHHLIDGRWIGQALARIEHRLDEPGQRLERHLLRFLERSARCDTTREIREAHAEIAIGIFMNNGDVIHCSVSASPPPPPSCGGAPPH